MPASTLPPQSLAAILLATLAGIMLLGFAIWWLIGHSVNLAQGSHALLTRSRVWGRTQTWRARAAGRYPRAWQLLRRRLDMSHFAGMPLTLLMLAALYLAILLGGLIEELLETDSIETVDRSLMTLVAPLRASALIPIANWITDLGSMPALTLVALTATGFMWTHGPRRYIAPVWLTVAGSQITTWSGKFLINRPRPDFILDISAYSPSFPSGHATGASAVIGIVAYVIARDLPHAKWRFVVVYCCAVVIALIGFSRVFLNVHYPSDVAAGFIVGTFWVIAGIALAELTKGQLKQASD